MVFTWTGEAGPLIRRIADLIASHALSRSGVELCATAHYLKGSAQVLLGLQDRSLCHCLGTSGIVSILERRPWVLFSLLVLLARQVQPRAPLIDCIAMRYWSILCNDRFIIFFFREIVMVYSLIVGISYTYDFRVHCLFPISVYLALMLCLLFHRTS